MKIKVDDYSEQDFTYLDDYIEKTINEYEDKMGFMIESYSKFLQILIYYKKLDFDDLKEILFIPAHTIIKEYDW